MTYLVDTGIVAELRKRDRCDAGVAAWYASIADDEVWLSVLTIGELRRGIERIGRRDSRSAEALDAWLAQIVALHEARVLAVDSAVADVWGHVNVPDPLPVIDGSLAATAIVHDLTLVTRNVQGVERTGVRYLEPCAATG